MASIVETSIKRPLLIVVIFTILTLGGGLSYTLLNLNLVPKMDLPVLTVVTVYPGAGASEVETGVTKKIEDALSALEDLKKITSTSQESTSIITIMFNESADIDKALQEAQRKINAIKSTLPREILDPSINKLSVDDKAIMQIAASSSLPPTQFYKLMEDRVQPRLAKLSGVGSVNMAGGNEREIKVNIDAEKLRAYNLSVLQVLQAVQNANMETPAGNVESDNATFSVRLAAKYASLDELRNTVVSVSQQGGEVRVSDVAEVQDGIAEQKMLNRIDGRDAIGLTIVKQGDANAVRVAELCKAELSAIEVDDSIVVIENMFTHIEQGKNRRQAALDGCRQIMFTVMTITAVITVVFLPLVVMGGIIGNLLREFAVPIIVATLSSLLVSFTVTPLLFSRFGKMSEHTRKTLSGRFSILVENLYTWLKNVYARLLSIALRHKITVVATAIVLFVGSLMLVGKGFIGFAFSPNIDQGEFAVNIDMNPSVTVYQNNQITMQVEKIIREKPEVMRVYSNVGSTGAMISNSSKNNTASISVKMIDRAERDIDVYDFSEQIKNEIMRQMPAGVSVLASGGMEQQSEAFGSLAFAFLAAIVIIYLIMVAMYNSLLDPVIVLMSIPLALIGAFLALALTMNDLNIFSIIGLIVLIGLVAKNAILLVDFANHIRREQGMDTFIALIEAGKERLRPILMTTFAMIFGMLPIALAAGNGAELKNGMAWVIIGGLTSSMILTLVVVPVVYMGFYKVKARFSKAIK